jgi:hypothetical protein
VLLVVELIDVEVDVVVDVEVVIVVALVVVTFEARCDIYINRRLILFSRHS